MNGGHFYIHSYIWYILAYFFHIIFLLSVIFPLFNYLPYLVVCLLLMFLNHTYIFVYLEYDSVFFAWLILGPCSFSEVLFHRSISFLHRIWRIVLQDTSFCDGSHFTVRFWILPYLLFLSCLCWEVCCSELVSFKCD